MEIAAAGVLRASNQCHMIQTSVLSDVKFSIIYHNCHRAALCYGPMAFAQRILVCSSLCTSFLFIPLQLRCIFSRSTSLKSTLRLSHPSQREFNFLHESFFPRFSPCALAPLPESKRCLSYGETSFVAKLGPDNIIFRYFEDIFEIC